MQDQPPQEGSTPNPFRRFLSGLSEFLGAKLELLGLELQEEKRRAFEALLLACFTVLAAVLALICLTFTLVICFWEQRVPIMIGLTIVYAIAAWILLQKLRERIQASGKVFETSIEELRKDAEWVNRL